jgi:glycerol-3-phosphate acyltransferase PlsX
MRITVDAMGGDNAPRAIVEGAFLSVQETDGLEVALVGPESVLREEVRRLGPGSGKLEIVDAPDQIAMHEAPAQAVKRKPSSSIVVGMRMQREGKAQAMVSAGNTGAVVAASLLHLGRLPGVSRPAIAAVVPNAAGGSLLLDVGANAQCKPLHLYQFAVMGELYARLLLGRETPRVGLLNVGEESSKGNDMVLEAHRLLSTSSLNFVGNVEGRGIFEGGVDVIVCDGFVGNVILKFGESVVGFLVSVMRRELGGSTRGRLGAHLLRPVFRHVQRELDYSEYGGAPLLGVNGTCIIAHGISNAKAIKNAIVAAGRLVENEANRRIQERLEAGIDEEQRATAQR